MGHRYAFACHRSLPCISKLTTCSDLTYCSEPHDAIGAQGVNAGFITGRKNSSAQVVFCDNCKVQLHSSIWCCTDIAACSHSLTLYTSVTKQPILGAQAYIASGAGKQPGQATNQASESAVASAPEAVQSTEPRQDIRRNLAEKYDDANTRVRNFPKTLWTMTAV